MEKMRDNILLTDIKNTEDEIEAYHLIARGNLVLSILPECNQTQRTMHLNEYKKYEGLASSANNFLQGLLSIKEKRGLE